MKTTHDILLLGNPKLNEKSSPVTQKDQTEIKGWIADLQSAMDDIKAKYHFGRGIAAPQLGIMKRLIVLNLDRQYILVNPEITEKSDALFELWDDCMSFPNLLVKVRRHERISIRFLDKNLNPQTWTVEGAVSELIQHEYDHLGGILATERAIDLKSFKWRIF
jgi:peptide deformylase